MPRGIPNKKPSGVKSDMAIISEVLVKAKELKQLTDMLDKRGYEVEVGSHSISIAVQS
jgi:hypothetical protein